MANYRAIVNIGGRLKELPTADRLVGVNKESYTFGDGTAKSFTITHTLNTMDLVWSVRDATTNEPRYPEVKPATATTVTVSGYVTAPAANAFRIVLVG